MNTQLAPIVIFSYDRLEHLIFTITSLKNNFLAKESDVIVYSDGYKSNNKSKVIDVRNYLKTVRGFNSFKIVERDSNFGLAKNIIEGVSEVIKNHGRIIVLEDDLVTSKNFLTFMNKAIKYYEKRDDIFSVSGYTGNLPSLDKINEDTYLSYRPSSWGWATWIDQWDAVDWNVSDFNNFISDRNKIKEFNIGGIDLTRMLRHFMEGKNNSWAIRWSYAMHKQSKYCIYPSVSKISNIGFGKDATHCKGVNIYDSLIDKDNKEDFFFSDALNPSDKIAKEFRYQFSYRNKAINFFKYL